VVHSQVSSKVARIATKIRRQNRLSSLGSSSAFAWCLKLSLAAVVVLQNWQPGFVSGNADTHSRRSVLQMCCRCCCNQHPECHPHTLRISPPPVKPQSCNIVKSQLHFDVGSRRRRRRSSGRSHNAFAGQVVPYNETIFNYLSK